MGSSSASSLPASAPAELVSACTSQPLTDTVLASLSDRMESADTAIACMQPELDEKLKALPKDLLAYSFSSDSRPKLAIKDGGKMHFLVEGILSCPRPAWVTRCGWKCGGATMAQIVSAPSLDSGIPSDFCLKCARSVGEVPGLGGAP